MTLSVRYVDAKQFEDLNDIEAVRLQPTPRDALEEAQFRKASVRPGWVEQKLNIAAVRVE